MAALITIPPPPTSFYLHVFRPTPGVTVSYSEVLPRLIRNARELHACALLCANSDVQGHFNRCQVGISTDRLYLEVTTEGGKIAKQHIGILDILEVNHALPPSFGVEALGNPLCGFRISIYTIDRVCVLYALTASDQIRWYEWLALQVDQRRERNLRNRFYATADGIESTTKSTEEQNSAREEEERRQLRAETAPIQIRKLTMHTQGTFDLPIETTTVPSSGTVPMSRHMGDPALASPGEGNAEVARAIVTTGKRGKGQDEQTRDFVDDASPGTRVRRVLDAPLVSAATEAEMRNPVNPSTQPPKGIDESLVQSSIASASMPPLRLCEADPDERHIVWRFGNEMLSAVPECDVNQLEAMRRLKVLECPGRWSEVGQAPPAALDRAPELGDDSPVKSSPMVFNAEGDNAVAAIAVKYRMRSAQEVLGGMRPLPKLDAERRRIQMQFEAPFPWISMNCAFPYEAKMLLLWKLAHLHVTEEPGETRLHRPVPYELAATEVADFWKTEYAEVRQVVVDKRRSLMKRLGVRKMAAKGQNLLDEKKFDIPKLIARDPGKPLSVLDLDEVKAALLAPPPEKKRKGEKQATAGSAESLAQVVVGDAKKLVGDAKKKVDSVKKDVKGFFEYLM